MPTRLSPCAVCARHVMVTAQRCPFCAAPLTRVVVRERRPGRLGRAAMFAFRTLTVASATACGASTGLEEGTGSDAETVIDSGAPFSGDTAVGDAAVWDAAVADTAVADTAVADAAAADTGEPEPDGSVIALYGGPMLIDVGPTDAGAETDADAGEDTGGLHPLYGGPTPS